jgi:hypothetical protein
MALHAEFPAASWAVKVIMLSPISSGTEALQLVVPVALPEPPVELRHSTYATATLSLAVPLIVIGLL